MVYSLTKSKYLHGLQCHKRLWYEKNPPEMERETDPSRSQQWRFDQGREVGCLARNRFSEGCLIDTTDPLEAVEQTQKAISNGVPYIFEASFIFNDIWVQCDILEKDSDSWKIIEVKASNNVKRKTGQIQRGVST